MNWELSWRIGRIETAIYVSLMAWAVGLGAGGTRMAWVQVGPVSVSVWWLR